jgi:hypothetical protein
LSARCARYSTAYLDQEEAAKRESAFSVMSGIATGLSTAILWVYVPRMLAV